MNTFDPEAGASSEQSPIVSNPVQEPAGVSFRINEASVIYQTFDQEVVAVHLNTGSYHTLPGIAGEAFLLLAAAGSSAPQMAAQLAARYDAPASVIETDLDIFLAQLLDQSMIVAIEAPPAPRLAEFPVPSEPLAPYIPPRLESFSDLEGLVLIDPVHDVGAAGWPNVAPETLDEVPSASAESYVLPLMRCRIASTNVIFERFNTETVVMDLGTGAYHSLSGEAEDIFLLFPSEPTTWEIRDALARKYTVETTDLEEAIRDYVNELVNARLIALEKLDQDKTGEGIAQRELQLSDADSGKPFKRPKLEVFAQPSFDGSFGEDITFSHEHTDRSAAVLGETSADHTAAPEPYARRRYAIRSGDLIFSTAGGETVICDRDEGKYFKLNQAASDVFRVLARKPDVSEVARALEQKYAVREQDLRVALMILLWNLRKVGLVTLERGDAAQTAAEDSPAPETPALAEPIPFKGFDVAMHHDLKDLLQPFNTLHPKYSKPKASRARQFLMLLESYFEEAAETAGLSEESFQVSGQPLTIRCPSGSPTAGLRTALQHLKTKVRESHTDGLMISAWHNGIVPAGPFLESTLAKLYENWSAVCGPRGEIFDFDCEEISAIYHPGPDTLSVMDRETGKAFYLLRDDAPLPFWELSSPFRHILHPWFSSCRLQYTHAGAVGSARGGVLLAGKGGSGKSTTSLLCLSAGMLYAADDYCLTRPAYAPGEDAQVFSLYNTAKLKGPEDLQRLPEMAGRSFNEDSFERGGVGKGTFNLSEVWPERIAAGFPLRAILLPTVIDSPDSRLEPCSPGDALLALAPSTLAQLPFSGQADSDRLAALADKVPAYRLYLGSDLAQIPRLVGDLIGERAG